MSTHPPAAPERETPDALGPLTASDISWLESIASNDPPSNALITGIFAWRILGTVARLAEVEARLGEAGKRETPADIAERLDDCKANARKLRGHSGAIYATGYVAKELAEQFEWLVGTARSLLARLGEAEAAGERMRTPPARGVIAESHDPYYVDLFKPGDSEPFYRMRVDGTGDEWSRKINEAHFAALAGVSPAGGGTEQAKAGDAPTHADAAPPSPAPATLAERIREMVAKHIKHGPPGWIDLNGGGRGISVEARPNVAHQLRFIRAIVVSLVEKGVDIAGREAAPSAGGGLADGILAMQPPPYVEREGVRDGWLMGRNAAAGYARVYGSAALTPAPQPAAPGKQDARADAEPETQR